MSKGKRRLGWFVLPAGKVRNEGWWGEVRKVMGLEAECIVWGEGKCRIMGESPRFRELEKNELAPQYLVTVYDSPDMSDPLAQRLLVMIKEVPVFHGGPADAATKSLLDRPTFHSRV